MFYLDAHWNQDLPLCEELDVILAAWRHCIVIIDDFEVPGQPGFKYDRYGDTKLSLELLDRRALASGGVELYAPAYAPSEDTGARCGYVVLTKGLAGERMAGALGGFPLSKLGRIG
jgi:hypothetical protein